MSRNRDRGSVLGTVWAAWKKLLGRGSMFNFAGGNAMEWISVQDRRNQGDWRVEGIDFDNEGQVYVTIFSGPDAQERADEYAEWKNAEQLQSLRKAG